MTSALIDEPTELGQSTALSLNHYKDLIAEDRHRIRRHDALVGEIQALRGRLGEEPFSVRNAHTLSVQEYLARVDRYDAVTGPLLPIMAAGAYWGDEQHVRLLGRCLTRLADPPGDRSGNTGLVNLRLYPALLLAYACGIGAVLAGRYDTLAKILVSSRVRRDNEQAPLVRALAHTNVISEDLLRQRPELERHRTPASAHLFAILKEPLETFVIDEVEYQWAYDRFEYLYALVHGDVYEKEGKAGRIWGPFGCFLWRKGIQEEIGREIIEQGNDWPPLKAGLFGGQVERVRQVKEQIDGMVHRYGW